MTSITFDLPLNPDWCFTDEALQQLAAKVPKTPMRLADEGGRATGDPIGRITATVVVDGRVRCTADVDDAIVDMVGGYGIDASVSRGVERNHITEVKRACVAGLAPSMLPPWARP